MHYVIWITSTFLQDVVFVDAEDLSPTCMPNTHATHDGPKSRSRSSPLAPKKHHHPLLLRCPALTMNVSPPSLSLYPEKLMVVILRWCRSWRDAAQLNFCCCSAAAAAAAAVAAAAAAAVLLLLMLMLMVSVTSPRVVAGCCCGFVEFLCSPRCLKLSRYDREWFPKSGPSAVDQIEVIKLFAIHCHNQQKCDKRHRQSVIGNFRASYRQKPVLSCICGMQSDHNLVLLLLLYLNGRVQRLRHDTHCVTMLLSLLSIAHIGQSLNRYQIAECAWCVLFTS